MPTRDFVVKLVGDSKSCQAAQDQATRALERFQRQNMSSGAMVSTLTSTLSRYIGVAAALRVAQEAVSRTIHGSQTSADNFNATMASAKTVVDAFFSSLNTGDWSAFSTGLNTITLQAREAYLALDRLGNARMSWQYFQSAGKADITDLRAQVWNTDLPMEQRRAAADQMRAVRDEMRTMAQGYEQRALEAMARTMTQATQLDWKEASREDLEKILGLSLLPSEISEKEKQRLQDRYAEYQRIAKEYREDFEKNDRVYEFDYITTLNTGYPVYGKVDKTPQESIDLFNQDMRELASEYQDAILYNEVLVRNSDEWLQNLIQIVQQADMAAASMRRIDSAVVEADRMLAKGTGKGTTATTSGSQPKYMTDLEYDRMITQERLKIVTKYSEDWVALQQQLITTESQMQEQRLRETIQNEDDLAAALVLLEQVKQRQLYDVAVEGYVKRLAAQGEFMEQSQSIAESTDDITGNMKSLRDSLDGIDDGGRAVENLGRAMSQLSDNKGWQGFGHIIAGVGSAVQAYTQLAAAAQLAATSQAAAETPTVWGKIAAVTSMLTVFTSMISQVQSMNSYAEGGIIGGNNFTDGIVARVSSGEMMINPADQKKLYDSIHSGDMGGGGGPAVITGEMIVMAVNAYGRRTNRGELLFAGR